MLVGGGRLRQFAGLRIDVEMSLARAVDAVGPVQPGVEPLRRVRRGHLRRQHVAVSSKKARASASEKVAALPAPVGPAAGEPIEDLLARGFADEAIASPAVLQGFFVGDAAPQPRRNGLFLDLLQARGDAGFAEILLRQHVGGDLRPGFRYFDVVGVKNNRAIRIADFARRVAESDVRVR